MEVNANLTIKACCLYEQLTGRSFYAINTQDDVLHLLYAMFINSNNLTITYPVFIGMLENKRVARGLTDEYERACAYLEQFELTKNFQEHIDKLKQEGRESEAMTMTMTNMAMSLIVQHHVDADYVMNKAQLWELLPLFEAADNARKVELIDKRFWTYLTIMPQVDGKKIKSPEQLIRFNWEAEEKKNKYQNDLDKKTKAIMDFFKAQEQAKKEREQNGTGPNNNDGPTGPSSN